MFNFGHVLVNENLNISLIDLIENLKIDFNDEVSVEKLIEIFNSTIKKSYYKVISITSKFENRMETTNYYLFNRLDNTYASELKIDILMNNCIKYMFSESNKDAYTKISNTIKKISKWNNFKELSKFK